VSEWLLYLLAPMAVMFMGVVLWLAWLLIWAVIHDFTCIGRWYDRHRQDIHSTLWVLVACYLIAGTLYAFLNLALAGNPGWPPEPWWVWWPILMAASSVLLLRLVEHLSGRRVESMAIYVLMPVIIGGLSFLLCGGTALFLTTTER